MEDDEWNEIEEEEEIAEQELNGEEEQAEGQFVRLLTGDGRLINIPMQLYRLIAGGLLGRLGGAEDAMEEDEDAPDNTNEEETAPKTLKGSELESQMKFESGLSVSSEVHNFASVYNRHIEGGPRFLGRLHSLYRGHYGRTMEDRARRFFSSGYIPNDSSLIDRYRNTVFCAEFSRDGDLFVTASQDRKIRIYNANNWTVRKRIQTRDMGWAVLCTDFSPNAQWVAYCGWDDNVHLVNTGGDHEVHEALEFIDSLHGRMALFSVKFSSDSRELLAGSKDCHAYLYDIETKQRTHRIKAHTDDINNVAWADSSAQVFFTGSDDRLIKVWDRRVANGDERAAGIFRGHTHGITYIDSRGDGRYLISNGKDQRIKLWDMRHMADGNPDENSESASTRLRGMFDYRIGVPSRQFLNRTLADDTSIMTYRGHAVAETLIRCKFSPFESTGQRYIYTGSYGGRVIIYDVLTGEIVKRLYGHTETVRDLDWHPTNGTLVSTGWDGLVLEWKWKSPSLDEEEEEDPIRRSHRPINFDDDENDDEE